MTRQLDAAVLYADGYTIPEIADRMGVARSTVKEYVDRAKRQYLPDGKGSKIALRKQLIAEGVVIGERQA